MILKLDQTLLDKYVPGKNVRKTLQTPFVRAYILDDETACFIATNKRKAQVSSYIAQIAALKKWNTSMHTEGNHLVCILYS